MKKLLQGTVIFFIVVACSYAVEFEDCGTGSLHGQVKAVDITGCEGGSTCVLRRGHDSTINIQFLSNKEAHSVNSVVHGIVQGIPVPFNLPNPDGCKFGGLMCPLTPNSVYSYTATLPIKKIYPKIHVKIQWELTNEENEDIICVRIPVQIK